MSANPYLSQIQIMGGTFAPRGWAKCAGQILPINSNQSLYSLLGTTFGGDGRTSFGLPDMRGRAPVNMGQGNGLTFRPLGQKSGQETHTLTQAELPQHSHTTTPVNATSTTFAATNQSANGNIPDYFGANFYSTNATSTGTMGSKMILPDQGGGQPHENMQPWIAMNYIIALQGVFPSRN